MAKAQPKAEPIDTTKIAQQQLAEMITEAQHLIERGKVLKHMPLTPQRRRACLDDELQWLHSELDKTLAIVSGKQTKILATLRQMPLPNRLDFLEALVLCEVPNLIEFLNGHYAKKYAAGMDEETLTAELADHNHQEITLHKKIYAHCNANKTDPPAFLRGEALTDFDPADKTFDVSKLLELRTNTERCADAARRFDEMLRGLNSELAKLRGLKQEIEEKRRAASPQENLSHEQLASRISKVESRIKEVTAEKEQNSKRRVLFNKLFNTAQSLLVENHVDYKSYI